jgi:hypothetical protein
MKRLVIATVLLTAVAVGAQAGSLPKPLRMVERMKMYSPTHGVRTPEGGKRHGGSQTSTAEARQEAAPTKPADQPKPAKAD